MTSENFARHGVHFTFLSAVSLQVSGSTASNINSTLSSHKNSCWPTVNENYISTWQNTFNHYKVFNITKITVGPEMFIRDLYSYT